jgi:iron complex transport system substrate-binding protein
MDRRIVSLLPAGTEIVCALGHGDALVGRSHECDFPPRVARLPALSEPRLDPHRSAAEIHASVAALLAEVLGIYRIDPIRLRDLAPTHVVTQVRCDVCAVSLEDVEAALDHWTSGRPKLVALNAGSLEDALFDIERVGLALGAQDEAELLVAGLRDRMAAISARALRTTSRPRVAAIEWLAPAMGAGNWIPELVDLAGGVNLFGRKGRHSPILNLAEIGASDPDVVVCFPCGFSLERVRRDAPEFFAQPALRELEAVRERRVYLADGNQFFNRPGPRLVESLEILAECIHPEAFAFGHEGVGFERLGGA